MISILFTEKLRKSKSKFFQANICAVTRLRVSRPRILSSISATGAGIFFSKMPRLVLGFTLPYRRVPDLVFQAVNDLKTTTHLYQVQTLKKHGFMLPLAMRLHDMVFN